MNEKILSEARLMIAGFLKSRREELGISVDDLAERMNMQRSSIWRIEQGKFWPRLDTLLRLCHELNCYFFIESKEGKGESAKMMRERWGKRSNN